MAGPTETLAAYAASVKFDTLPASVRENVLLHLQDGLGNQLAASRVADPARLTLALFREWGGKQEAPVVGYGDWLPLAQAAMVNAMLGHGVELDDAHSDALLKAGSSLVPVALAAGISARRSGRDVLAALVAGYELAVRIGLAINPSHRKRGFHTSGTAATFGAAAVAARLLGGGAPEIRSALGLAGIQAAGIQAYLDDPCMAKPLSPGKAAWNGALAGALAVRGFTGPGTVLEARDGFLAAYADQVRPELLTEGLGDVFRILEVGFKPHAACRYAHGPIDCAQALHRTHPLRGGDIERVVVEASALAIRQAGRCRTNSMNAAMGSIPAGVALGLLRGSNSLKDYAAVLHDDEVRSLAASVEVRTAMGIPETGRQSRVSLHLKDGKVVEHRVDGPRGDPGMPMSAGEFEAKFASLAGLALTPPRLKALREMLAGFEMLADVSEAAPLLVADVPVQAGMRG